jgi:hypothetical protein
MNIRWRALILAVSFLCPACGSSPTSPSTTSSSTTSTTSLPSFFELTVPQGADSFYSFTQSQNGNMSATLASITVGKSPAAVPIIMRLGVGVPAGEGCAVNNFVDVTPSLTTEFTATLVPGTYCIDVADIGNLPADAVVSVRYAHS